MFQCVKELFTDIVAMPKYTSEFMAIIEASLIKYIDKCKTKYQELTEDTEAGIALTCFVCNEKVQCCQLQNMCRD